MTTSNLSTDEVPWFDKRWAWRVPFWQNHQKISGKEDLIDFPMLIEWASPALSNAQPTGADFLFTAGDGVTKLSHEIREWSKESLQLRAYVKVPRLSSHHDTLIFLYFGNPAVPNQEDRCGVWEDYEFVGNPIKPAEHGMRVLEALFSDPELASLRQRNPDHPAVCNFDSLKELCQGQLFDKVNWSSQSIRIGVAMLDMLAIRNNDPEFAWELVAEPEALRQIRTRLDDPEQFQDQFSVIRCWSLLHGIGINARLVERSGWPDIAAEGPCGTAWFEVKRFRLGTRITRVRKDISDANKQIRNTSDTAVGTVYLEVTRPIETEQLSDEIPLEVSNCISEVKRECGSGHSKNVGRVVVSWDEVSILGHPPALTKFVFRRRTVVIDHKDPLSPPTVSIPEAAGRTVDFNIKWR